MADRYWIGGTGNWNDTAHWSATNGGAGGAVVPTSSDDVYITSFSGFGTGGTISLNGAYYSTKCNNFSSQSGHNYMIDCVSSDLSIHGSYIGESGLTWFADTWIYFKSNNTGNTITTNGGTLYCISFGDQDIGDGPGSWTLQDDLIITGGFYQENGAFDANDHNVTAESFYIIADTGHTPTVIMGSGTWEGLNWIIMEYNEEVVTITPETSTIKIKPIEQSENTFAGGGKTYNKLWIDADGLGVIVIGSNTFNELKISAGSTVQFEQLKTQTVTTFTATGTVGNLITLESYGPIPGGVVDYAINNYGTGYSIADLITVTGGNSNFTFIVYDVDGSGTVTDYGAGTMSSGYSTGNNIATTGGTGTGFTVNITEVNPALDQFTLSKSSGTVSCDYLNLTLSNAEGGATWDAGSHSVDTTNNDGWIFIFADKPNTTNFLQFF